MVPEVVEVKKPPLRVKLLGTIIEPGKSKAMLGTAAGRVELRGVGEVVGEENPDAEIVRIEPNLVELRRQEEVITLEISQK